MKVTYNWLKDFVDIKIPAPELADKLTMAGLEVKSIEERSGDFVFEIEITSNRPDWLSVLGIAREVAALTGKKLRTPKVPARKPRFKKTPAEKFSIEIENKKDCSLYTARVIRGVKVGDSPQWLKDRLDLVGLRSVNNVVDITNYVLYELGEPLHAFDLDKLSGPAIIVRRSKNGEEIVSIDGQTRKLSGDILVIADREKPAAVAGVMGGKETEVTVSTKNILLEAAVFDPVVIRRGRQKLAMSSDASYRFERGIDPQSAQSASRRAAGLVEDLCGGAEVVLKSAGTDQAKPVKVAFSFRDVPRYLGADLPVARQKSILAGLGFAFKSCGKDGLTVSVPSWRLDINSPVDLIEEIARIFGYENIPSTLASVVLNNQQEKSQDHIGYIKNVLTGLGLDEAITYSLVERKSLDGFWEKKDSLIEVANPLSLEQEVMRPVLIPSLAARVAYNLRQQASSVKLFEIARTYCLESGRIKEKYSLCLALCGAQSLWFGPKQGHIQDAPGFLHLKGIIDALLERLGIAGAQYSFISDSEAELKINGERAGILKNLSVRVLESLDIKHKEVFAAEILLEEKILPLVRLDRRFDPAGVPKYPGIRRDITLPVKSAVTFAEISVAILDLKEELLVNAGFKDCYEGGSVPAGTKRITVSLRYGSPERTLTEEEVAPAHTRLVKALEDKFQIKLVD